MAAADCEMFGVAMEEGAGSGGDIAASSCDEGGYWAAAESSECAGTAVAPLESAGSALLDSALGSLVEASHSEGFGCDPLALPPRAVPLSQLLLRDQPLWNSLF